MWCNRKLQREHPNNVPVSEPTMFFLRKNRGIKITFIFGKTDSYLQKSHILSSVNVSNTVLYYKLGQCWQHKPEPVGPRSMMLLFSSLISVCVESSTSPPLFSWGACWLACCCMDAPRAFPWGLIPAICSSSATMCKATRLALWQIAITTQLFSF